MITLTRLSGTTVAVNPDLISRITASPDTTIVTIDGGTFIVKETMEQVIDVIKDFRADVITRTLDRRSK